MMTYEEQEKIERLVAKDENAQKLITALRDDYHMALSQISHEIRNPLTYIDSSVQWIQKMHPEVEHFEFWDQIKNDLQYMRVLLDDISAFNNGDKLNICKIDPVEFACDLKDTLLPELLAHHIPLLLKLDNTYPDFYADPVRLKQVFINLLTNAIDSIEERGRITLKIFTHNKRMLLAVRDPRVVSNPAYLTIILLSRVITSLGTLTSSRNHDPGRTLPGMVSGNPYRTEYPGHWR